MYALFVKISRWENTSTWLFQGMANNDDQVGGFVRSMEKEIKITRDLEIKTISYKVVELED